MSSSAPIQANRPKTQIEQSTNDLSKDGIKDLFRQMQDAIQSEDKSKQHEIESKLRSAAVFDKKDFGDAVKDLEKFPSIDIKKLLGELADEDTNKNTGKKMDLTELYSMLQDPPPKTPDVDTSGLNL